MPIVKVTALPQRPGADLDNVSAAVVRAVAQALGEDPAGTWITWHTLAPGAYREGLSAAPAAQPTDTHPPLVRVDAFEGRAPETIARVLDAAAAAMVTGLSLAPGNVVVIWNELSAGRLHAGGAMPGT